MRRVILFRWARHFASPGETGVSRLPEEYRLTGYQSRQFGPSAQERAARTRLPDRRPRRQILKLISHEAAM
jgi:hypothetical protein